MEHIGEYDGYQVYRTTDGNLEGYKTTGNKVVNNRNIGTDCKRIVTTAKTLPDYIDQYLRTKLKPKKVEEQKPPTLFNEEQI